MSTHGATGVMDTPRPADMPARTGTMPGWHIVADLTPPELIASRRVQKVRVWVVAAAVLVAAACAGGYVWARGEAHTVAASLTSEQATTQTLIDRQRSYTNVTSLQAAIDQVKAQTATLMASDVDVDALLGKIWAALPDGMTISQIAVTVPSTVAGADARDPSSGVGALDTSGAVHIGTVTLTGSGTAITDVPDFVDKLGAIPGVFAPFPTSNTADATGIQYSVQLTLTDTVLSNMFAAKGGS